MALRLENERGVASVYIKSANSSVPTIYHHASSEFCMLVNNVERRAFGCFFQFFLYFGACIFMIWQHAHLLHDLWYSIDFSSMHYLKVKSATAAAAAAVANINICLYFCM